jgi:transposase
MESTEPETPAEPAPMSSPESTRKPSPLKGRTRRIISDKEKVLYVVRWKKLKTSLLQGSKQLGVSESALGKWVKAFEKQKLSPAQKAALSNAEHGTIPQETKFKAIAEIDAGLPASEVAKKYGVHKDSVKDWYRKTGRPWPNQWRVIAKAKQKALSGDGPTGKYKHAADEHRAAIERVANGERARFVAQEYGVTIGALYNWWEKYRPKEKWPSQAKWLGATIDKGAPRGPQKKTRDRMSVREAVLSNSRVLTAQAQLVNPPEEINGNHQPISTGKATHDALIFLQLARDEYMKAVKAGKMRVDDPTMLFPMLALHTLSK